MSDSKKVSCNCIDCRKEAAVSVAKKPVIEKSTTKIGTILWYNRNLGYGFVAAGGIGSLFFHHSTVELEGFNSKTKLKKRKSVKVTVEGTKKNPKTGKTEHKVTKIAKL